MTTPLPPLLLEGDCIAMMRRLDDDSIDAIVTDPPYGLSDASPAQIADVLRHWTNGGRDAAPTGRGFMGKSWDAFVPPPAVWDEAMRVLKPGGHLLAFAGSRTFDLMALSVRLAGFEIRDSIAWLYGSGFPKSLDVSKAIDKRGGSAVTPQAIAAAIKAARERHGWSKAKADEVFCEGSTLYSWFEGRPRGIRTPTVATFALMVEAWPELAPLAAEVADVEREATGTHANGLGRGTSGAGGMGEGKERRDRPATDAAREWEGWGTALKPAFEPVVVARKPLIGTVAANVLAHGTGALNIDASRIDAEPGDVASVLGTKRSGGIMGESSPRDSPSEPHAAGRFPANVILDESQAAALDAQSGYRPGGSAPKSSGRSRPGANGTMGDGWAGIEREAAIRFDGGGASRFFYVAKAPKSERPNVDGVAHPTVKPLALMRHLVRLVTPPGGVVLDPFAGSGATLEAAYLEGFESIGCELTPDYWPLIEARIERVAGALAPSNAARRTARG